MDGGPGVGHESGQSPVYIRKYGDTGIVSIDGGNTKLANFGQTSDASDFLTTGVQGSNDPFDREQSTSPFVFTSERGAPFSTAGSPG